MVLEEQSFFYWVEDAWGLPWVLFSLVLTVLRVAVSVRDAEVRIIPIAYMALIEVHASEQLLGDSDAFAMEPHITYFTADHEILGAFQVLTPADAMGAFLAVWLLELPKVGLFGSRDPLGNFSSAGLEAVMVHHMQLLV